jgi:2-oxoglutarate ferredoxin oxidoreductase subunit beta
MTAEALSNGHANGHRRTGLSLVPTSEAEQKRKDYASDQEVRWCPGCGDYAILAAFQSFLPELGLARENVIVLSGIGCAARFPYYMNTYGMHSIHGRAPAIATGLAATRPDLAVFVISGDGDALSIGGNHLIHALRRNVNLTILLFNNRIYGLTKGQYSPTSEVGKITKSTPVGSLDTPFNPVSLALGAEASFVARAIDSDRKQLTGVLHEAAAHRGTSLVEIYQNCNIFNDGAFGQVKDPETRDDATLRMAPGEPLRYGAEAEHGVRRSATGGLELCAGDDPDVLVHDPAADDPTTAFALSRLASPTPIGIFRSVDRPAYDDGLGEQVAAAQAEPDAGDLEVLLRGGDTWTIS